MPAPAAAVAFSGVMDSSDRVEYIASFADLLEQGEKISTATVTLYAEAVALGFTVLTGTGLAAAIVNDNSVRIWVEVAANMRDNAAFTAGAKMPVEFAVVTDATPFRRFHRTMTITVTQL